MVETEYTILECFTKKIARVISRRMRRPARLWWDDELSLRTVNVNGHEICYVVAGRGPPVVLVHGFCTSLSIWANQVRALSEHFEVYAIDLIGHGYSEKPDIKYSPELYMGILSGFLAALKIPAATFVGHSMGGLFSICLAAVAPECVPRLVLIGSSSPLYRPERLVRFLEKVKRRPWFWKRLFLLYELLVPVPLKLIEKRGEKKMLHKPEDIGCEWASHLYEIRRTKGFSRMVVSTGEHFIELAQYEDRVKDIQQPALLLWGASDKVIPVEHGRLLQGTLRNARLEVIPECGHFPMIDQPDETTRLLLDFLLQPRQ